ncbi:hypothetical protein [Parendozoicomonas sp. Alg238-R29]|uniref:hypothetical protein n=1 Tax=Parendozoicomonas sp. Alg238-R29 TaxID=2993446 RepID=UPI00248E2A89|nr:hypothetical protein [Parendozoicomonas sp. Alg238-R29]
MDIETDLKILRNGHQNAYHTFIFNVLSIHGSVDPRTDDIPSSLSMTLVPASFERLLAARKAIDDGVSIAGCFLRPSDLETDLPEHLLRGAELRLTLIPEAENYQLQAQCYCQSTGCIYQAEQFIEKSWFDNRLEQS